MPSVLSVAIKWTWSSRLDMKVAGSNRPTAGQFSPFGSLLLVTVIFLEMIYIVTSLRNQIKDKKDNRFVSRNWKDRVFVNGSWINPGPS